MIKKLYKQTITRLVYAWVLLFSLLISMIVLLYILGGYLQEERILREEQLKLIGFTYKTELVSHNLTNSVIYFSLAFDPASLALYWNELQKIRRVDDYIIHLKNLHGSAKELKLILQAKNIADSIRENELKSIKLILSAYQVNSSVIPQELQDFHLSEIEEKLPPKEKLNLAHELVQTPLYLENKNKIFSLVKEARGEIIKRSQLATQSVKKKIDACIFYLNIAAFLALFIVIGIIWFRALSIKKWLR